MASLLSGPKAILISKYNIQRKSFNAQIKATKTFNYPNAIPMEFSCHHKKWLSKLKS